MTVTTEVKEAAAMAAAGATDAELVETIRELTATHNLADDDVQLLRACVDEQEVRAQARFETRLYLEGQK